MEPAPYGPLALFEDSKTRRLGTHLAEATTTVDRPIALGAEGYRGVGAALSTDYLIHFPGRVLVHPAVTLLGPSNRPAASAPFGLIGKTS